jgi:hypothetical protein
VFTYNLTSDLFRLNFFEMQESEIWDLCDLDPITLGDGLLCWAGVTVALGTVYKSVLNFASKSVNVSVLSV